MVAAFAFVRPTYNWDAIAYYALAERVPGDDVATVHAKGYGVLNRTASAHVVAELSASNEYRRVQATNPDAFASMLPMYAVKRGYIASLRALAPAVGTVQAVRLVGVVSFAVLMSVVLGWAWFGGFIQAAPIALLVTLALQMREQVSGGTPDLPATALIVTALAACWSNRTWWAVPLLAAATTFRPDTVVVAFALVIASAVTRRDIVPAIATFSASALAYLWCTGGVETIGWWAHYSFSNVRYVNDLTGFEPPFSLLAYLKGQARGVVLSLAHFNWPIVLACVLAGWAWLASRGRATDARTVWLVLAALMATAGKFVLFPLPDDRIHAAPIIAATMVLLASWRPSIVSARTNRGLRTP